MSIVLGSDTFPTARKGHQCHYCFDSIMPGERYGRRVGASGGDFWIMKFHPECDAHATATWKHDDWAENDWENKSFDRPITAFDPAI